MHFPIFIDGGLILVNIMVNLKLNIKINHFDIFDSFKKKENGLHLNFYQMKKNIQRRDAM